MQVGVVVLGDLGRSPRMRYHAESLAESGHQVALIGYEGSDLPRTVRDNPNITIRHINKFSVPLMLPKLLQYFLKTIFQSLYLLLCLPVMSKLDCILVQTPPGVPALPVLSLYCLVKGSRLVVDFHNYSDTILAMSCGKSHPLVRLTRWLENLFGLTADAAFCVTKAMQQDLQNNWGIQATVLYDRPPQHFRPITTEEKHQLLLRLSEEYTELRGEHPSSTIITQEKDGQVMLLPNRPAFQVCWLAPPPGQKMKTSQFSFRLWKTTRKGALMRIYQILSA